MESTNSIDTTYGAASLVGTVNTDKDLEKARSTIALTSHESPTPSWRKPYQFWLASLSLWLVVLLVTLDATALAVAIPVRAPPSESHIQN